MTVDTAIPDGTARPTPQTETLCYDWEDDSLYGMDDFGMNAVRRPRSFSFKICWDYFNAMPKEVWEMLDDYAWASRKEISFVRVPEYVVEQFAQKYYDFVQEVKAEEEARMPKYLNSEFPART